MTEPTAEAQDFPRESWAFVVRMVSDESYLIYYRGEISLLDRTSFRKLMRKILKEQ